MSNKSPQQTRDDDTQLMKSIHHFWFGSLDIEMPSQDTMNRWFTYSPETDAEITKRYKAVLRKAEAKKYAHWRNNAQGSLVLVLLFDQFPRNMFRGRSEAFKYAPLGEDTASHAIDQQFDLQMHTAERVFCYLPFMHSEILASQERSVTLFKKLLAATSVTEYEFVKLSLSMAREHCGIIKRFGRFPHRNEALGRQSTEEETMFLAEESQQYEWMTNHSR